MKKTLLLLAVAVATSTTYAKAETLNATAEATIQSPITITKVADPNFATVLHGTATSTITLNEDNTVTVTTGTDTTAGTPTTGEYTLTGSASTAVNIAVANIVNLKNGTTELTTTLTPSATSVSLDGAGSGSVKVTGNIVIPAGAVPVGAYAGTFDLNVTY